MHLNIEIKARCKDPQSVREVLKAHDALFIGTDEQEDTYFNVPNGRLKLRLGPIERSLIHYDRKNESGPKASEVSLMEVQDGAALKAILTKSMGIKVVVQKTREIYFIGNVKFHIDQVPQLGSFVEIEAIDKDGSIGRDTLQQQCERYIQLFKIQPDDLMNSSYSDMLLQ